MPQEQLPTASRWPNGNFVVTDEQNVMPSHGKKSAMHDLPRPWRDEWLTHISKCPSLKSAWAGMDWRVSVPRYAFVFERFASLLTATIASDGEGKGDDAIVDIRAVNAAASAPPVVGSLPPALAATQQSPTGARSDARTRTGIASRTPKRYPRNSRRIESAEGVEVVVQVWI